MKNHFALSMAFWIFVEVLNKYNLNYILKSQDVFKPEYNGCPWDPILVIVNCQEVVAQRLLCHNII